MSIEKYRNQKRMEYAAANAEETVAVTEQSQAIIDYNVMMGKLDDPEMEVNEIE